MSRWQPDARERLERAALELFEEQGFAATTVPEITARAGLTTRTFFRHFADKREVFFAGDDLPALARQMLAKASASGGDDPLDQLLAGLRVASEELFDGRRDDIRRRRAIIRSDEGLRERELRKRAAFGEVAREALVARGVPGDRALLLAETAMTLFMVSIENWLDRDHDCPLFEVVTENLSALRGLIR